MTVENIQEVLNKHTAGINLISLITPITLNKSDNPNNPNESDNPNNINKP